MRAPLVTAAPALQIGQANLAVARFTPPAAAPPPVAPTRPAGSNSRKSGSPHWTIPQLVAAGPAGPRKGMKIVGLGRMSVLGAARSRISHGAIEAEQLFDPERA
jgi:hypothetical protein